MAKEVVIGNMHDVFEATHKIRDLISVVVDSPANYIDLGYITIVDTGNYWAVSFLVGIESEVDWWENIDSHKYTAKASLLVDAVNDAYNQVLAELKRFADAYKMLRQF